MNETQILKGYEYAKAQYAAVGVDVDAAIATKLGELHIRALIANALKLSVVVDVAADIDHNNLIYVVVLSKELMELLAQEILVLATHGNDD